jgi:hypothetical protein
VSTSWWPRPAACSTTTSQGTLDLKQVEIFVLDEADRMLDMGFIHDIKKVLALLPAKKQSLLFSATFSDEIKALADRCSTQPALIEVARRNATADTVAQKRLPGGPRAQEGVAGAPDQDRHDWHQVLVFTRMKFGANRLAEYLDDQGITAMAIHGNKSQSARTKALAEFKAGSCSVLVATDIAARGIDIDELPHVVNFELPNVPEDYVHRIGRTGRAGCEGEALSLVCLDEELFLRDIEKLVKRSIPREAVPGFEPPANEKAEPIVLGRMTIGVGGTQRNGGAWSRGRLVFQSALAPLAFTTFSYLASSPFTKAPNCSGVPGAVSAIRLAMRAFISGEAKASAKALFKRARVSPGKRAGPKRPNQVLMSKLRSPRAAPASATVGTSGMALIAARWSRPAP